MFLHGSGCWIINKKEENQISASEMTVHFKGKFKGFTLRNHTRNEDVQNKLQVIALLDQINKQRCVDWRLKENRIPKSVLKYKRMSKK